MHITARTQGRAPLFTDSINDSIKSILLDGIVSSDAQLIAYAVMPNHFHLVLRQGSHTLGWVMQPIMRRLALLVQRAHNVSGHVFEREFYSLPCQGGLHLRRAIVYTNLNRVRGKLCDVGGPHSWCSHGWMVEEARRSGIVDVAHILNLFREKKNSTRKQLVDVYLKYVEWRLAKDAADEAGVPCPFVEPLCLAGDTYFAQHFAALPIRPEAPRGDLRDVAVDILKIIDEAMPISNLRQSYVTRAESAVRNQVIAGLRQRGFEVRDIAHFFRVTDTVVSRVNIRMRFAGLAEKWKSGKFKVVRR